MCVASFTNRCTHPAPWSHSGKVGSEVQNGFGGWTPAEPPPSTPSSAASGSPLTTRLSPKSWKTNPTLLPITGDIDFCHCGLFSALSLCWPLIRGQLGKQISGWTWADKNPHLPTLCAKRCPRLLLCTNSEKRAPCKE